MAELVQNDAEGEAAAIQAHLVPGDILGGKAELVPAAAVDVEGADPLSIAERGILRKEKGPVLRGGSRNQPERRLVHVRRDLKIDAEEVLDPLEGENNLVLLPADPADRRQRVEAIIGPLRDAPNDIAEK